MLKGSLLAIAFLVGIFWLDWGTLHHANNNYPRSSNSAYQQEAAAQPNALSQINKTKTTQTGTTKQQTSPEQFVKWVEWFFSDTNRAIATGTFLLAFGAFAQVELTRRTARRQLRAYVFLDLAGIADASQIPAAVNLPASG